jgi:hypothetical protein
MTTIRRLGRTDMKILLLGAKDIGIPPLTHEDIQNPSPLSQSYNLHNGWVVSAAHSNPIPNLRPVS